MEDYYAEHLAAEKLRRCYEIAPPRVQQYLRAELDFALGFIQANDSVLDLGCGYGRSHRGLVSILDLAEEQHQQGQVFFKYFWEMMPVSLPAPSGPTANFETRP